MNGFIGDIEKETVTNENFRKVIFTGPKSQLVVMSLLPLEDIGMEVHDVDQFIRIESGHGKAVLDGVEHEVGDDFAIVIPAGTKHNIINTSETLPMKLYTVYSPAEHPDKTVDVTKQAAIQREGH